MLYNSRGTVRKVSIILNEKIFNFIYRQENLSQKNKKFKSAHSKKTFNMLKYNDFKERNLITIVHFRGSK